MSDKPPPLTDAERDDLVAYLDGELKGQAAEAVQARLSLDPAYRAEAEALRRSWQMLDFLPKTEASPTFSHRTVERLAALRPPAASPGRSWTWAKRLGWAAALLLAAAGGFAGFTLLCPRDGTDEDLARDLRIIENKRYYEHVDDLQFLWRLDDPDLFGDDSGG
jgi:hypothetical protein